MAQEVRFLNGVIRENDSRDRSYTLSMTYLQGLGENTAVSFSWLNEGHFQHHHRDGHSIQVWARTKPQKRLVFAAGVGPYRYFDTKTAQEGGSYVDSHGWGVILSLSASWRLDNRWLFLVQSNYIKTERSLDTHTLSAGIGYQLEAAIPPGQAPISSEIDSIPINEVTVFLGQTIVNSGESENDHARAIEYRRRLGRYLDWTIAWLNEGDPQLIHRNGIITELWLTRHFSDPNISLGLGIGPYIAVDERRNPDADREDNDVIVGIITMSAAYKFNSPWVIRISWNRIVTDYNRDTDVLLWGVGYRF